MKSEQHNESPHMLTCESCGGTLIFSPRNQQLKCTNCGFEKTLNLTPVQLKTYPLETADQEFSSPDAVVPFKIDKKECKEFYQSWLKNEWVVPTKLKKNIPEPTEFQASYLPYFAFNAKFSTTYDGSMKYRDDDNSDTWKNVSGQLEAELHHVLIPAISTETAYEASDLEHWKFDEAVACKEEVFSGFDAVRPTKELSYIKDEAHQKMDKKVEELIKKNIGGEDQQVTKKQIHYEKVTFNFLYLPVWTSSYLYKNKTYRFVIDGSTGEVKGDFPFSKTKVALFIGIFVVAILFIWYTLSHSDLVFE